MSALDPIAVLRALVISDDPTDQDRWLLRVALLEAAGIEASITALSRIGGCSEEHTEGAVAVLATSTDGYIEAYIEDPQP